MSNLSTEDYVIGFIVACWLVALLGFLPNWLEQIGRGRLRPPPEPSPSPEWSRIDDYVELASAAGAAHGLAADAFLEGPFRRFVEIASDPDDHPRARARMMEFGRAALASYCKALAERGGDATAFEARARAFAAERFAQAPNGDYMLEVLDGISNHNWRGKREA